MFLSVSEELSSKLPVFSSVSVHPPVSCELPSPHGLLCRLACHSHSRSPHWEDAPSICRPCKAQLLPQMSRKKCVMPSFTPGWDSLGTDSFQHSTSVAKSGPWKVSKQGLKVQIAGFLYSSLVEESVYILNKLLEQRRDGENQIFFFLKICSINCDPKHQSRCQADLFS